MRKSFPIVTALVTLVMACNYTDGQCWVDTEGQGYGGTPDGPIVPAGAGGYGDVPPEPQIEPEETDSPECNAIGSYSSSLFKFTTTVADDGTGKAGGYQEATAPVVKFVDGRQSPPTSWTCSVWVGMPARTETEGKISASRAAEIAADVLTMASGITMHRRSSWIQAAFCKQLQDDMRSTFIHVYPGVGGSARAQ